MKLIVASDEKTDLTKSVVKYLKEKNHQVVLMGDLVERNDKWAEIGWDNANILCLSLRYTSETIAREILDIWFSTKFDEEVLNEAHKLDD